MTNILVAINNIVKNPVNDLSSQYQSLNRINSMGEALEFYVKDIFCGTFSEKDSERKNTMYAKEFSYLGNQNNPPDIIIKQGDAIEVKKIIGTQTGSLALNSSYPKDFLFSENPMITRACRDCEAWSKKDLLYVVGQVVENKLKTLWMVYGECYAANSDVYDRIKNAITLGVNSLPDIEFGDTKEFARVNRVDPLGITDLRLRGMWQIKHPESVFSYLNLESGNDFTVNALMLNAKYESFPAEDRKVIETSDNKGLAIRDVKIKNPNNPAKMLDAKFISFKR